jgi:hypothetical protein
MKQVLQIVSVLVFLAGGMTLAGCAMTSDQSRSNDVAASGNGSQSTTMPSDRQTSAESDNSYIGNGAFGEPPP